jgi:hypothetical protein
MEKSTGAVDLAPAEGIGNLQHYIISVNCPDKKRIGLEKRVTLRAPRDTDIPRRGPKRQPYRRVPPRTHCRQRNVDTEAKIMRRGKKERNKRACQWAPAG